MLFRSNIAQGGGGGSGYVISSGTNKTLTAGGTPTAANTGDADYVSGKAVGAVNNGASGAGYVVIYY